MQPAAISRSLRLLAASRASLRPLFRPSSTTARTADPAVHSEDPQGDDAAEAAKAAAAEEKQRAEHKDEEAKPPRNFSDDVVPPFAPSPKLESHDVAPPWPPSFQQKRRLSQRPDPAVIANVPCVGPDGSPLDGKATEERREQEQEYKEYYKHHKPSPLSEIEFVDTRKPITQATAGGASDVGGDTGRGMMVEETVDEALARAEAMFRMRAMMGDPDLPHSRVLRRMLEKTSESRTSSSLY
ncbi:hypothetical protein Cni_G04808 [Canna indica]|uniref:Uncharacterized protein n=1 Tax=Canna indica TaxID=4628 RepID=A0AAQ3JWK0_9LILI|nr:hypothetical protein Cni_G04808 [Canna indica]